MNGGFGVVVGTIFTGLDELIAELAPMRGQGQKVVWTNGCFDILHAGHVMYLDEARRLGDILVVGVNGDASVRAVKGERRPVNSEEDRALVLSALGSVNYVLIFPETDTVPILAQLKPDVYAKGGDYTIDTINQDERKFVEGYGGEIVLLSGVDGKSTTDIIRRMRA